MREPSQWLQDPIEKIPQINSPTHLKGEVNIVCGGEFAKLRVTQTFEYVNFDSPLYMVVNLLAFNKAEIYICT